MQIEPEKVIKRSAIDELVASLQSDDSWIYHIHPAHVNPALAIQEDYQHPNSIVDVEIRLFQVSRKVNWLGKWLRTRRFEWLLSYFPVELVKRLASAVRWRRQLHRGKLPAWMFQRESRRGHWLFITIHEATSFVFVARLIRPVWHTGILPTGWWKVDSIDIQC